MALAAWDAPPPLDGLHIIVGVSCEGWGCGRRSRLRRRWCTAYVRRVGVTTHDGVFRLALSLCAAATVLRHECDGRSHGRTRRTDGGGASGCVSALHALLLLLCGCFRRFVRFPAKRHYCHKSHLPSPSPAPSPAEMRSKPKLKGMSRQGGRYVATINLDGEDQDLGRFASEFEVSEKLGRDWRREGRGALSLGPGASRCMGMRRPPPHLPLHPPTRTCTLVAVLSRCLRCRRLMGLH